MHDLIAIGVAEARQRKRWTQEDAARAFRKHGLTSWRTGTVGQLEAGLRRPRLDEVLLICAALGCTLDKLLPDIDEPIEVGDGAVFSSAAVRSLLSAGTAGGVASEMHFPADSEAEQMLSRAVAEVQRIEPLLAPIRQHALELGEDDYRAALEFPNDAERHAARKLGAHPAQVKLAARALWHHDFAAERDARIGDADTLSPRSLQARRGLVTRSMLGDLRTFLDEAVGNRG